MKRAAPAAMAVLALAAAVDGASAAASPGLAFQDVFSAKGEPASLHFRASYTARGALHDVELWRQGDRRLVRRTDGAIEMHVARREGDAAYQMVVLDRRRKIETRVTRDDLYRIGNFTDWFDLAHALRTPKAGYRLAAVPRDRLPALETAAPCRWYALEQASHETRICWSTEYRVPLAMVDDRGRPVWHVESIDRKPVPAEVLQVRDEGYVRNDASPDISGD